MPSDGARTARLVALMAGHGFIFVRLFDRFDTILKDQTLPIATWVIITIPLVGIGTAYLALCGEATSRVARTFEAVSLFLLTLLAALTLWWTAGQLHLLNFPHPS